MVGRHSSISYPSREVTELVERCDDPRCLRRLLDGTSLARSCIGLKEGAWQKVLQKLALLFDKHAYTDLQAHVGTLEAFIEQEFQRLERVDYYVKESIIKALVATLPRLHGAIARGKRFWPACVQSASIKAAGFHYFLERYDETYIRGQASAHARFFAGAEALPVVSGKSGASGLNEYQVRSILVNDEYTLAIAGPGSGKTRTLADRIAFYVLKKHVPPASILVLAYNKAAASEIESRLLASFGITDVRINTFHSIGFGILRRFLGSKARGLSVESNKTKVIRDIVTKLKASDDAFQNAYISFFARYRDLDPGHGTASDPLDAAIRARATADMFLHEQQKKYNALDGTLVKSIAERDIANFFITRGIAYAYEPLVTWCDSDKPEKAYHPDFYLPAHDVYLEHWSMSEHGKVPGWFAPAKPGQRPPEHPGPGNATPTEAYATIRDWKRAQFAKHGKVLWETDHVLWASGELEPALERYCDSRGIPATPLPAGALLAFIDRFPNDARVIDDEIASCISSAKANGYTLETFQDMVRGKQGSLKPHEKAFLELAIPVFSAYTRHLRSSGRIDFDDMINDACHHMALQRSNPLASARDAVPLPSYAMIMVDEFQDISKQRLELLRELCALHPDPRLFCVGDDWQAIYGFSGSSNRYLVDCDRFFPGHRMVKLVHNYRNPKDVIDFGGRVISKSKERFIPKDLIAVKAQEPGGRARLAPVVPLVPLAPASRAPPASQASQASPAANERPPSPVFIKRVPAADEMAFWSAQSSIARDRIKELLAGGAKPGDILVLSRFNFGYSRLQDACERDAATTPVALVKEGKVIKAGIRFLSIHGSKGLEAPHVIILNAYEGKYGLPAASRGWLDPKILNPDLSDPEDEERRLFFVGITRARDTLTVITWQGQESRFLDAVPSAADFFQGAATLWLEGTIARESEKSYLVRLEYGFNEGIETWIPKSQIEAWQPPGTGRSVKFKVSDWWWRKKLADLDLRDEIRKKSR